MSEATLNKCFCEGLYEKSVVSVHYNLCFHEAQIELHRFSRKLSVMQKIDP
jgi:hypothetical protein